MNSKTAGALVVFVALLGAAYYFVTRPDKGERTGERPRPVPALSADQIKRLKLTAKGETVVLERRGADRWQVVDPLTYPADSSAVKSAVDKITELEFGDLVTELKSKHAKLGVDADQGIRVEVSDGDKLLAAFVVGKVIDSFTMLRPADRDQVYQAVGSLSYAFDRELKNWRDRTIVSFTQDKTRSLRVTTPDGTIALGRADAKADWKVQESPTAITALDTAAVTRLLNTLSSLSAFEFADGAKPAAVGLASPRARIEVELEGGTTHTLLVGNSAKEDHWVKARGKDQIYKLKQHAIDSLVLRPIDFRDKTVLALDTAKIASVSFHKLDGDTKLTLTAKDGVWHRGADKVEDPKNVKSAVDTLASLKAEGFARQGAAELGLDRPAWRITITLDDGSSSVLTIGSVDRDGTRGLRRAGEEVIYTVRKYTVDQIVIDPADYDKR